MVGRSEIVGKPIAMMLMQKGPGGDATVTVCHSRSRDLPAITRAADILIVAIGRANFVTADMVKPGAVVIDVGINRTEKGLVGDVDFEAGQPGCRLHHARARRRRPADDHDALAQHAAGGPAANGVSARSIPLFPTGLRKLSGAFIASKCLVFSRGGRETKHRRG